MISLAHGDDERVEALDLFSSAIPGIASDAVPMTRLDELYSPLVAQARDDKTGELLGAALTCRPQVAAGAIRLREHVRPAGLTKAMNRISELDLMAVRPDARGHGLGTQMIQMLERELAVRGVRVWFGNVTRDLQVAALRRFYMHAGFTVLSDGQPLPPLLGQEWVPPSAETPAFYFWKQITAYSRALTHNGLTVG